MQIRPLTRGTAAEGGRGVIHSPFKRRHYPRLHPPEERCYKPVVLRGRICMRHNRLFRRIATLALSILMGACATTPSGPPAAAGPQRTKEQNIEFGRQHKTAADLFKALRDEAKGGQKLESVSYTHLTLPTSD